LSYDSHKILEHYLEQGFSTYGPKTIFDGLWLGIIENYYVLQAKAKAKLCNAKCT